MCTTCSCDSLVYRLSVRLHYTASCALAKYNAAFCALLESAFLRWTRQKLHRPPLFIFSAFPPAAYSGDRWWWWWEWDAQTSSASSSWSSCYLFLWSLVMMLRCTVCIAPPARSTGHEDGQSDDWKKHWKCKPLFLVQKLITTFPRAKPDHNSTGDHGDDAE